MRRVGQAVVSCQTTVRAIGQGIGRCGSAGARIFIIKGTHRSGGNRFRANKATQRTDGDVGRRVAVIDLVGSTALAARYEPQGFFINRGVVRGVGKAIVAGQTSVNTIYQGVERRRCSSTGVLAIKSTHRSGRDSLEVYEAGERSQRDARRGVAVIGLVRGAAARYG